MNLITLPQELAVMICNHLDLQSLQAARKSCLYLKTASETTDKMKRFRELLALCENYFRVLGQLLPPQGGTVSHNVIYVSQKTKKVKAVRLPLAANQSSVPLRVSIGEDPVKVEKRRSGCCTFVVNGCRKATFDYRACSSLFVTVLEDRFEITVPEANQALFPPPEELTFFFECANNSTKLEKSELINEIIKRDLIT